MKKAKLLFLLPFTGLVLTGCSVEETFNSVKDWVLSLFSAKQAEPKKEEPKDTTPEGGNQDPLEPEGPVYTVTLTADNSTLTTDDSTEDIQVELASNEDANVKYTFEITAPCYLNTKSQVAKQICVKSGAMIRSVSTYHVQKITVDFFGGKGVNYEVYNNTEHTGTAVSYTETDILPTDPDDSGLVYDYSINSNGWSVYNGSTYKPTFYYISVTFTK